MKKIIIGPISFRRWLSRHEPQQIVGKFCSSTACPVANFIKSQHGKRVSAGGRYIVFATDWGYHKRRTPMIFRAFMNTVDNGRAQYVTAEKAIEILDNLLP